VTIRLLVIISVAAPKVSSIFHRKFHKISTLEIESFCNFATIKKIVTKIVISKFDKNENIEEHM